MTKPAPPERNETTGAVVAWAPWPVAKYAVFDCRGHLVGHRRDAPGRAGVRRVPAWRALGASRTGAYPYQPARPPRGEGPRRCANVRGARSAARRGGMAGEAAECGHEVRRGESDGGQGAALMITTTLQQQALRSSVFLLMDERRRLEQELIDMEQKMMAATDWRRGAQRWTSRWRRTVRRWRLWSRSRAQKEDADRQAAAEAAAKVARERLTGHAREMADAHEGKLEALGRAELHMVAAVAAINEALLARRWSALRRQRCRSR